MISQYLIVTLRLSPAVVHLVEKLRESALSTTPPNSLSIAPASSHHPHFIHSTIPLLYPNISCTRGTRLYGPKDI